MTTRDWKFYVWKSTATSLSTALVDFTIDNSKLAAVPTITGSRLRVLDGRTEARPWTMDILDASSFITSQIGDAGGRLDLLNRFVQANLSIDGGAYSAVAGGRLIDAINTGNIATWQFTVQDEWLAGANARLFTTNTTLLYPPRPIRGYKDVGSGWAAIGAASRIATTETTPKRYWLVTLNPGVPGTPPLTDEAVSFIRGDVKTHLAGLSTKGGFTHLRFRLNGTDYGVVGFKTLRGIVWTGGIAHHNVTRPDPEDRLFDEDELYEHQSKGGPLSFWVAASSTAFGGTGAITFDFTTAKSAALHAMSAPASVATPLHIWNWSSANPFGTLHPMQVLKDVLSGVYSSSSEGLPYYSTQSFTGTKDVRLLPTVGVAFRITNTATLKDWCEEHLLAPHGIAAFGDNTGKVAFKSVLIPDPQMGYSTANMYSFTSTNLRAPHPDWRTTRREQVTQIQLDYEMVARGTIVGRTAGRMPDYGNVTHPSGPYGWTQGGDGIASAVASTFVNHDRMSRYGVWPLRYTFDGYGALGRYDAYAAFPDWVGSMAYYQNEVCGRIFNRFGDGPMSGTLYALPNASTVLPGDFCRLPLASYPSPAGGGARGAGRLIQVLTKDITPEGYAYEFLDAGASPTPLASPTFTLSTSTAYPKHVLRATVTGGIPSGGGMNFYMAESATTSPPSSTSAAWHPVYTTVGGARSTGVYTFPRLKSNTRFFVKAQAGAPNRVLSAYTASQTKVTAAITSITGLTMSSVKAHTAGSTWTLGDGDYPVDWHVDTSTNGSPTTSNLLARFPAGTAKYLTAGLTASQKYRSWVRHADPYGGYSGFDSTTFTMTSTATTSNVRKSPPLGGLYTVFGST